MTLLLYLRDVEYGKRLLHFLVHKKNPGIHPELVTVRKKMEYRIETAPEEVVVLTDDPVLYEDGKHKIIILSNEQNRLQRKIFQYQKAEGIYQELLWQLKLEPERKQPLEERRGYSQERVFAVFSPDAAGAAMLSVMLAQFMACRGRCLYLQLSGFPVYAGSDLQEGAESAAEGMGELLFMLEQKNFTERTKVLCRRFGKADMLPPLTHFKDLLDCRPEDWDRFLKRLKKDCGYDYLVIETGLVYEYFLDILASADRVLFLESAGCMGRIQRAVFNRYCLIEKKEELLTRTKYVRQPEDFAVPAGEWEKIELDQLSDDSDRMACIKDILEGGEKEDDYIEEDIG